jgi:hypothetical protein
MKFDSDKFIELYTKRYSLPDEDLQLTISRLINDGIQATENDELKAFTTLVEQCIENPNDIYKTYGDYKKTNLEKAMELWLMY